VYFPCGRWIGCARLGRGLCSLEVGGQFPGDTYCKWFAITGISAGRASGRGGLSQAFSGKLVRNGITEKANDFT
jgi:hypothetical protein